MQLITKFKNKLHNLINKILACRAYFISLSIWFMFIIFLIIFMLLNGTLFLSDVSFRYILYFNILLSFLFYLTHELMYFFDNRVQIYTNFTMRDITFISLLLFGPFGLILIFIVMLGCMDKPTNKFENLINSLNYKGRLENIYMDYVSSTINHVYSIPYESIFESVSSDNIHKKRNSVMVLSKIKDEQSINVLKQMARDKDYEVRFIAINKLNEIESRFMKDFSEFQLAIEICGMVPELLFQYAMVMLSFCRLNILYDELNVLYLNKALKIFESLIKHNYLKIDSIYGYVICKKLLGNIDDAITILKNNFKDLNAKLIDELAECYFIKKDYENLKEIIVLAKNNKLPYDEKIKKLITQVDSLEDGYLNDINESIYPIDNPVQFLNLLLNSENINFEKNYERLKEVDNPAFFNFVLMDVFNSSRFVKLLFLKLLKLKVDSEIAKSLKYFLFDKDIIVALFALETLCVTDFPFKNEMFVSLLNHYSDYVKIVAIYGCGVKRIRYASIQIFKILKYVNSSKEIKKECITALIKIGGYLSKKAIIHGLYKEDEEICIYTLNEIKNHNLEDYLNEIYYFVLKTNNMKLKKIAVEVIASFNSTSTNDLLYNLLNVKDEFILEIVVSKLCKKLDIKVAELAANYYFKTNFKYMDDLKYYFSYIDEKKIKTHIEYLIKTNTFFKSRFIDLLLIYQKDVVKKVIQEFHQKNPNFNVFYELLTKGEKSNG